jgi:ribonucleoside-triphosphate reductase
VHGYLKGEHFNCPKCREEKEREIRERIAALQNERQAVLAGAV